MKIETIAYVRDFDGEGSLHPCAKHDPDAIAVADADAALTAQEHAFKAGFAAARKSGSDGGRIHRSAGSAWGQYE